ncbi:MAG: DEAD/DEAH box helicase family protein [Candidatus Obscuribacterales bacterium]|nr:DEAD/DEAH box helicase family protein [Candidatus Obscuribacterales bacterium]
MVINTQSANETVDGSAISIADLSFQYPLRRYQQEILELVKIKLKRGENKLHIVAPPGAGKTIIGLQLVSEFKCPSLIVSPNTTIQSQWGQKLELFMPPHLKSYGLDDLIGTHEDMPLKPITTLTYQVLSTPGREQEYLERLARKSWLEEICRAQSLSAGNAELRMIELMQNNPREYQNEVSRHLSRLRRRLTEVLDLKEVLHDNALELLQSLRRQKFALVIFDECHHLTDYWAAVMTHLVKRLDNAVVIGLTGTPPEGKSNQQENRYLTLVGEIDYQVPTPALVKEGGLAPFQDLVHITQPTETEYSFLELQHEDFHTLVDELTKRRSEEKQSPLTAWVQARLDEFLSSDEKNMPEWQRELTTACIRYLWRLEKPLPKGIELSEQLCQSPLLDDWMNILEDYALRKLKISSEASDHEMYQVIKSAVRKLGYALTEQGIRKQASPVDRVLAFSKNKAHAVAEILNLEYRSLDDRLRAAVVTDFERMSALETKSLKGVLTAESGGAIGVFHELLKEPIAEFVNPCLVTGSLLLVDKRIGEQFLTAAEQYVKQEGLKLALSKIDNDEFGYCEITGNSSAWETRLYVGLATELFERGLSKCLIGTRGLFGEGWDSQALNTLIDLTTTTSPVSVKQLRGRSLRINTNDPLGGRKVANNWDVVCVAPQLEKGLNDYSRFVRKHDGYFGIADDGQIECGVGHVHPAFSELTPADVFASSEELNTEMNLRALARDGIYDLWKVGQPYANKSLGCVELTRLKKMALTPPHIRQDLPYKEHIKYLRSHLNGIWLEYLGIGSAVSAILAYMLTSYGILVFAAALPLVFSLVIAIRKHSSLYDRLKAQVCQPNTQESSLKDMALAVFSALQQMRLLPNYLEHKAVTVTRRSDGSFRVFLDEAEEVHADIFAAAFEETMAPLNNQPYIMPKYEYSLEPVEPIEVLEKQEESSDGTKEIPKPISTQTKDPVERFFKSYLAGKCEPYIASYHAIPKVLARSEKGRETFEAAWNKYVSPGFIIETETKPHLLKRYFGIGPSLAHKLIWE